MESDGRDFPAGPDAASGPRILKKIPRQKRFLLSGNSVHDMHGRFFGGRPDRRLSEAYTSSRTTSIAPSPFLWPILMMRV